MLIEPCLCAQLGNAACNTCPWNGTYNIPPQESTGCKDPPGAVWSMRERPDIYGPTPCSQLGLHSVTPVGCKRTMLHAQTWWVLLERMSWAGGMKEGREREGMVREEGKASQSDAFAPPGGTQPIKTE